MKILSLGACQKSADISQLVGLTPPPPPDRILIGWKIYIIYGLLYIIVINIMQLSWFLVIQFE
jgi:hypothetical protein